MARNSYFLQGSQSEQRLIQDLINEQLKIYGLDITYIPRKFVNTKSIIEEVQSSKFDDNFVLEAYVNSYDGYSGAGDVLTKFGMSLRDEVELTISKERFEDFISPFMSASDNIDLASRPREGDLVFFPLGQRLFEVKFVEHEEPFYQLGKNYVYQLKCELFEYEGEVIDTSIDAIDTQIEDEGFITTLNMVSAGTTATATAVLSQPTGYVRELFLTNDGSGYTTTPTVAISTAPGATGVSATAVAITTTRAGVKSIERIVLTNAGSGYTSPPTITIIGGNGTGAIATCSIETTQKGVISYTVTNQGGGYSAVPTITVAGPTGSGTTSTAEAVINADKQVTSIRVTNPGIGYTQVPAVSFSAPAAVGVGTFYYNEVIRGQTSLTEARVRSWDVDTKILKVANVGIGTTISGFIPGETIIGTGSTIAGEYAAYTLGSHDNRDIYDEYDSNDEIESEADSMIDFTESNPFGQF